MSFKAIVAVSSMPTIREFDQYAFLKHLSKWQIYTGAISSLATLWSAISIAISKAH